MRIEIAFSQFHLDNPHVYIRLLQMAKQLKAKGYQHYGMKGLFEVLRWETAISTHGSLFKLNNNYTSLYARLIMKHEPTLKGFFRTREISSQVIE